MVVLLDRVHAWLPKGIDEHLWESPPSFLLILRSSGVGRPDREWFGTAESSRRWQSARMGIMFIQVASQTSYRAMFQKSSGPLLGADTSKPKRGCLSVNMGTREACLIRVITQPGRHLAVQVSPMRQTSGGAAVVVRGWESQPHGEGRQDVSFWITEGFVNREGSR